jgi:fumarylacetoacetate (FAA) hydrolase
MKLASLKSGRDGALIVISRDLARAVRADGIAHTLQYALDNWDTLSHELGVLYDALNAESIENAFAFDPAACAAPLPRAYQWADGSAYVTHVELVRKSRGVEMPASFWTDPLMYQGGSDAFLGPCDAIEIADEAWGIDFEAEVAVITDSVPMGASASEAASHIRLLMLVNDVSLRNLAPAELAKGFGFFQCKPSSAFSPVAVTPDELGNAWSDGKVHLPLVTTLDGREFGRPNAGVDMVFNFPALIAHAAKTRHLAAGTIIGSGTVSNRDHKTAGSSCIVERRMLEKLESGEEKTPYLRFGNRVRIEMLDGAGRSVFGAIDQRVKKYERKEKAA